MKKIPTYIFFICFFHTQALKAQVELDHKLIFTSTDSSERNFFNLGTPQQITDASRVKEVARSSNLVPAGTISIVADTLLISLFPSPIQLDTSLVLHIILPGSFNLQGFVKINQFPAKKILTSGGWGLFPSELQPNDVIQIMYGDSAFYIINHTAHECPNGFTSMNEKYCIETNERVATFFWNAVETCNSINARLCTWGEWYYACVNAGMGLQSMTNNYEFIDDASDHTQYIALVGNSLCTNMDNVSVVLTSPAYWRNYRCCYSKR
ncbi:MAG: hypothetical protein ACHQF2_02785 [Flavobacteriales bacterium]